MHAAVEYTARHPEIAGGYLILLTVSDEHELHFTASKLELYDVDVEWFREPDMGNALTAIATGDPVAERKLSKLPLALRGGDDGGREHVLVADESRGSKGSE